MIYYVLITRQGPLYFLYVVRGFLHNDLSYITEAIVLKLFIPDLRHVRQVLHVDKAADLFVVEHVYDLQLYNRLLHDIVGTCAPTMVHFIESLSFLVFLWPLRAILVERLVLLLVDLNYIKEAQTFCILMPFGILGSRIIEFFLIKILLVKR